MDHFTRLDKAEQKHHLIMEWGHLIYPLEELARSATPPPIANYRQAFSSFLAGGRAMQDHIRVFCTFNDIIYSPTVNQLCTVVALAPGSPMWSVWRTIIDASSGGAMGLADQFIIRLFARFSDALREVRSRFFKLVEEVPITWEAKLYQANTPFTVYMRLQDAIAGVQQRLDYFDNFLKEDFFQLYLRHVERSVAIRLVTRHGAAGRSGVEGIRHLSELCRQEFADYKLVEVGSNDLHFRMLRVDKRIFNLDIGTSDAGKYPTLFTPAPSEPPDHQVLDDILNRGTIVHQS